MAGFSRVSGGDSGFNQYTINSITVAAGDLLAFDRANNVVILATSTTSREDIAGVALEARTASDTTVLVQKVTDNDEYIADTTNNTTTASNYERMVLTDENAVNNTGADSTSDAAVVEQLYPVGATTDKKIRCRFIPLMDRA